MTFPALKGADTNQRSQEQAGQLFEEVANV